MFGLVYLPLVERDRVSGAWVFRGTRVPVSYLFEILGAGCFGKTGPHIDQFV